MSCVIQKTNPVWRVLLKPDKHAVNYAANTLDTHTVNQTCVNRHFLAWIRCKVDQALCSVSGSPSGFPVWSSFFITPLHNAHTIKYHSHNISLKCNPAQHFNNTNQTTREQQHDRTPVNYTTTQLKPWSPEQNHRGSWKPSLESRSGFIWAGKHTDNHSKLRGAVLRVL